MWPPLNKNNVLMMICFDVTQVEMSRSPPSWYMRGLWSLIGPLLFKTIKTIDPFWEREEFNLVLINKSNDDLTSHRKGWVGPLSHDMCLNNRFWLGRFCWRQSEQYIPTRGGHTLMHKLMCTFVAMMKKKKIPDQNLDTACPAGRLMNNYYKLVYV